MNIQQIDKQYVANTYARFPVQLVSGKGSIVYDENGKEYIDLGTGIAVNGLGIADEGWKNAIINQLNKIQHTSNLYFSEPCALLAKALCARTGMKKVFFSNSGAEANETAIKAARKYGEINKAGKEIQGAQLLQHWEPALEQGGHLYRCGRGRFPDPYADFDHAVPSLPHADPGWLCLYRRIAAV